MEKCDVLNCDVYEGIKKIKGRWVSVILFSLEEKDKTFSEIKNDFPFLTNAQLSLNLQNMTTNNLITKIDIKYTLTSDGKKYCKVLDLIEEIN